MLFRVFIEFFSLILVFNSACSSSYTVRIYANQAEFIEQVKTLPLEFTEEQWNRIRADSITLLGENVKIISQTMTRIRPSRNGAKIYVRSPMTFDSTTLVMLPGVLIDETTNLVKVEDQSMGEKKPLYFSVPPSHIFFLDEPTKMKVQVNFTYNSSDSPVFISYLQSSLSWSPQYQLHLHDENSVLNAMANVHHRDQSTISIDRAQLISGDIHLRGQHSTTAYDTSARRNEALALLDSSSHAEVEEGAELHGLYTFDINGPFVLEGQTNVLLPMIDPEVTVQRFGWISKYFSRTNEKGKARRAYRLRSNRFLPRGNCLVRESDRVVGETLLSDISANEPFDFSLGEDPDLLYEENVSFISTTETKDSTASSPIIIRKKSLYDIALHVNNHKTRSMTIEYTQHIYQYTRFEVISFNKHPFIRDGTTIKLNVTLAPNDKQIFTYRLQIIE